MNKKGSERKNEIEKQAIREHEEQRLGEEGRMKKESYSSPTIEKGIVMTGFCFIGQDLTLSIEQIYIGNMN